MRHLFCLALLSLASTVAVAQEKTIEPGLYEVTTKTNMGTSQTARVCLNAKDITSGLNPVIDPKCKRVRNVIAGGKLDFATTCPDMAMTATGSYTATSYAIDGKVVMKGDDDPAIESHITAKRVAASCPGS